jgi:hypothetical protein
VSLNEKDYDTEILRGSEIQINIPYKHNNFIELLLIITSIKVKYFTHSVFINPSTIFIIKPIAASNFFP